jgi:hypothetical protein
MKSVLPPKLEAARIRIARAHNHLAMLLMVLLIGALFGLLYYAPEAMKSDPLKPLLLVIAVELAAFLGVVRYDNFQCRRLGLMCPACRKPLYESRSMFYLNGKCPKCKRQIFSAPP